MPLYLSAPPNNTSPLVPRLSMASANALPLKSLGLIESIPDLAKASLTKVFDTSSLNLKASPGLPNFVKTSIAPSKNCGLFGLIKSLYISGSTVMRLASLSAVFTKSSKFFNCVLPCNFSSISLPSLKSALAFFNCSPALVSNVASSLVNFAP